MINQSNYLERKPQNSPQKMKVPFKPPSRKGVYLCLLVFLIILCPSCKRQVSPDTPNLLLISLDTTRADYIGCYGSSDVKTPNMDQLASKGVNFMRTVAPSQCTNPSHASMLTGLYLAVHGMYDNQTRLADEIITLAEILGDKGYATLAAVSARHLNPSNSNFGQGFDEFLECDPIELNAQERNQEFLERLRKIVGRSFFAWIHYYDPHGDYAPPTPYDKVYPVGSEFEPVKPAESMDLSREKKSGPVDPDEIIPLYMGEISFLDEFIGELLDALVEIGIDKDTLVVLAADHGESMTEKNIYFCHAGLYNTVTHVPMIMSLPGKIPEGIEVYSLTSLVDIFPTALDILGYDYDNKKINGKSLVPAFSNPEYKPHDFVISEAVNGVIGGIYQNEYKYLKPYAKDWAVKEAHLFRFPEDYEEEVDLKDEEAEIAQKMESFLDAWLIEAKSKAFKSRYRKKLDKKMREALKSLGYIKD